MDNDVFIKPGSQVFIQGDNGHPLKVDRLTGIEPLRIKTPIAAHIKEVNNIDPISIDALNVSEVKNIDPIRVEKFNVTNLPMVNMSLRQLPQVDMNIRKIPPLSIGTHQDFHVPSNYTVSGRILGVEFFRINLDGHTMVLPRERYRREQEKVPEKSFPLPATAGNPAIPSTRREVGRQVCRPLSMCRPAAKIVKCNSPAPAYRTYGKMGQASNYKNYKDPSISFGMPNISFYMDDLNQGGNLSSSSVSSGE